MVRKYNLDEQISEGDPLHPETHEAIAGAVNDLDDRTANIETDLSTRLSPTELSATIASETAVIVPGLVADAVADDSTVVAAAAAAVTDEIAGRDMVEAFYAESSEAVAGFRGENGRGTDLVVDADGVVPGSVLGRWSSRLIAEHGVAAGRPWASPVAAGGIAGENGRLLLGFDAAGALVPESVAKLAGALAGNLTHREPYDGWDGARLLRGLDGRLLTSRADRIAAWGDSLTQGFPRPPFAADLSDSWPGVLDAGWDGTVFNGGVSGQSADEIAIRQGGYQLTLAAGVTIPTTGAVDITVEQVIGWRLDRPWSAVGTLGGIAGTLSRPIGSTLTFTRTVGGDSTVAAAGTPFVSTLGETHAESVQVIFAGRNDIGYTSPAGHPVDRVIAATVAMVERPGVSHRRTLVVGITTATSETAGSTGHTYITQINRALAQLYPSLWFDLRGYLVRDAIHDLGITPTAGDTEAMSGDTLPPSIMHDAVHYLPSTAALVAAQIKTQLTEKGWIN